MLRPEIAPSLRATLVPPGFQAQPVLQAMQHADLLQELHMQQQTARIHALEASVIHMQGKIDKKDEQLRDKDETIAGLKAAMRPHAPIDCDVVLTITVNDFDYHCGFNYANDIGEPLRLELQEVWAIGAVLLNELNMADLRIALERAAEKRLLTEAQDMRDELAIDAYEFERGGH